MKNYLKNSRSKNYQHELGRNGEDDALAFLQQKGYRLLDRHFSTHWGEIDLVMEWNNMVVFVEVKTRMGRGYGEPEEAITKTKRDHMVKAALFYIQVKRHVDRMMRFDVIAIGPSGLRHVPHAFSAGGHYYY